MIYHFLHIHYPFPCTFQFVAETPSFHHKYFDCAFNKELPRHHFQIFILLKHPSGLQMYNSQGEQNQTSNLFLRMMSELQLPCSGSRYQHGERFHSIVLRHASVALAFKILL